MKNMSILILALILALVITGCASAEVTVAAKSTSSTPQAGNSYTTGSIYVVSTPPGSSAILDGGENQLFTPGTFSSVLPGVHNVMITMPGYQPSTSVVTVSAGTTQNVNVDLVTGHFTREHITLLDSQGGRVSMLTRSTRGKQTRLSGTLQQARTN